MGGVTRVMNSAVAGTLEVDGILGKFLTSLVAIVPFRFRKARLKFEDGQLVVVWRMFGVGETRLMLSFPNIRALALSATADGANRATGV